MKTQKITSKNAAYQKFEVLRENRNKRYKYQEFIIEGVRNINKAVEEGWTIKSLIYDGERRLSDWARNVLNHTSTEINYELSSVLMKDISKKEDSSELLAVVGMRNDDLESVVLSKNPVIALFDRPSNKGNLGTIIRSCDALGVECLIITGHAVDVYDSEVVASSMGSLFQVPVIRVAENQTIVDFMRKLKKQYPTLQVIGTTAHKEYPIYELNLSTPILFMIGNETNGLSQMYKEHCDILTTIPMAATSYATSFNVGCAATVLFYEAQRQRINYP